MKFVSTPLSSLREAWSYTNYEVINLATHQALHLLVQDAARKLVPYYMIYPDKYEAALRACKFYYDSLPHNDVEFEARNNYPELYI